MKILMCAGDEDRSERTKCANDWKSQELVTTCEPVLGESTEIWHVDCKRREKTDNNVQAS